MTVGTLWDVAAFRGGDENVDNDGLKVDMNTSTPTPHNDVAGQSIHDNNVTQQRRKSEQHTVMDGSAFLEASRKIDEAATFSRKASNEKAVGRVHFDNESFLETFLEDPTNTTNFFISYYKSVMKRVPSNDTIYSLLSTYVGAISPLGSEKRRAPMNMKGVDDFPLKEVLSLFIDSNQLPFGKRVIEGYVWLSCQDILSGKKKESNGVYSCDRAVACGPKLLVTVCDPLVILCNGLGWEKLEDLLVESVEKLCEFGKVAMALDFCQNIASKSSTLAGGGVLHKSRVCAKMFRMMTKHAYATIIARYHHNPTETANHVISFARKSSDAKFSRALLNELVDVMSPADKTRRQLPQGGVNTFPLREILSLIIEGKFYALGKRVVEGYIWLSSQEVRWTTHSQFGGSRTSTVQPKGPTLLSSAFDPLMSLCKALGWNEFEDVFVEATQKIFQFGKPGRNSFEYMHSPIDLMEKFHPATREDTDCSRVCAKMATIACDELFKGLQEMQGSSLIPIYTKFVRLIANFCPAVAPRFETFVKNLDIDVMLYPLLSDEYFRSSASSSGVGKNILSQLTNHCAQLLHSRVSSDPDIITAWTVPNAHACQNENFTKFLQNQCKCTFDWKVRKSDHEGLQKELRALVDAGDVSCGSYQPYSGAPYHFKITKLKTCRVHLNALSCSCSSDVDEKKITHQPKDCLRDSSKVKRAKEMLQSLKTCLTPEQIRGLSSQKRKAVDALGDNNDDDVVLTGVAGVAETVAKRVKAAEDAGEVIEIH